VLGGSGATDRTSSPSEARNPRTRSGGSGAEDPKRRLGRGQGLEVRDLRRLPGQRKEKGSVGEQGAAHTLGELAEGVAEHPPQPLQRLAPAPETHRLQKARISAVVADLQAHAVGRLVEQEGEPGPARHVDHLINAEAKALGLHDLVDGLHPPLPDPREHQEIDDLARAPQGLEELGVDLAPEQGGGVRQPPPDLCAGGRVELDPVHEAVGVAADLARLHLHAVHALGTTGEIDQVGV